MKAMPQKMVKSRPVEMQASLLGVGILGFGLGALLAGFVQQYVLWIILFGAALHGWGMYRMHTGKQTLFSKILYWLCWAILAGLIIYIAMGFV